MDNWASLGGFGNVDMRGSLPVGKTDNTGALGMVGQALLRQIAMNAQRQRTPEEDDPELAQLFAQAFGMARRQRPQQAQQPQLPNMNVMGPGGTLGGGV